MGAEGYYMDVTDTVVVRAPQQTGLLYGAITVVQSFTPTRRKPLSPKGIARDYPAYKVRGAFWTWPVWVTLWSIWKKSPSTWPGFKMNDFHLHLNDKADQDYKSFRLESDLQT